MMNVFLRHLSAGGVFGGCVALLLLFISSGAHADADKIRLVWNDNPATTVVIAWDQLNGDTPVLKYDTMDHGRSAASYRFETPPTRVTPYRGMNNHFAKLEDLHADTAYYFLIEDSEGTSQRFWFRTAPSINQPFTFVAGGDTGTTAELLERAGWSHRMVAKLRPLFVLFNGNFCSDYGTSDAYWQLWLSRWSEDTRTADGRVFPLVPVTGSRETGDLSVLYNLFDASYQNDDVTAVFYGLDIGHNLLHLTLLNSEVPVDDYQGAWLSHDLATHSGFEFNAVAYHRAIRPHTTSAPEQDSQYDAWAGLFYDFGVDLAFEGGSHVHKITYPIRPSDEAGQHEGYIRDDLFGTMYVGEGSWGTELQAVDAVKPWTLASAGVNQIKWLHVYPSTADEPGAIDIYTVITGTSDDGEYRETVSAVGENSDADVFAIPEGLTLADTPEDSEAVTYPVRRQLEGFSLQQGMNGYQGTVDIGIWENAPESPNTTGPVAAVVNSDLGGTRQALLKFTNIFGDLQWQVPWSCDIERGLLRLWIADGTEGPISLHRMLVNWTPETTWQSLSGGINIDDMETSSNPAASDKGISGYDYHWFDVTASLEYWHENIGTNFGWGILNGGEDEMTFYTAEWASVRHRPKLIVQCAAAPDSDGPTPIEEIDTGVPDPLPPTVRRLPGDTVYDTEAPPTTVELTPADDTHPDTISGCHCHAAAGGGSLLLPLLSMLFR